MYRTLSKNPSIPYKKSQDSGKYDKNGNARIKQKNLQLGHSTILFVMLEAQQINT